MRTAAVVLLAVAMFASATASLLAHEKYRFIGSLSKIDRKEDSLVVAYKAEGKDQTVAVYLTDASVITRDGKKIAKTALKVGLYLVVDAWGDDYDDLEALEIRVVPRPRR